MYYVEFPCNPMTNVLPFTPCLLTYIPSLLSSSPRFSPQIKVLEMASARSPIPLIPVAEDMVLDIRVNMEGLAGHMRSLQDTARVSQRSSVSQNHAMPFLLKLPCRLCHGTPWHWNQDPTLHLFNQRDRLVNCLSPSFHTPTHLSSRFSLFEICKLPEVMHGVQVSDLDKPCTNPFHHFSPGLEASSPVCLPFK